MTENTSGITRHHGALRLLLGATATYAALGLLAGLFYREYTKANGFTDGLMGQLGLVHTHILTLGMLVMLIVLTLEKVFRLSTSRLARWFFWIYNLGVVLTSAMLTWHGMLQVQGVEGSKVISGIAGLGHILIGAGFVLLLLNLRAALRRDERAAL